MCCVHVTFVYWLLDICSWLLIKMKWYLLFICAIAWYKGTRWNGEESDNDNDHEDNYYDGQYSAWWTIPTSARNTLLSVDVPSIATPTEAGLLYAAQIIAFRIWVTLLAVHVERTKRTRNHVTVWAIATSHTWKIF